ncbi:MAG: DGQHR domain-containing protein [Scytonema hyalinum WJT4-NPBG1]|jgi:DGQHR domain-containing protein|nr:DGQHR domain-containing protein [Scytonema hyalinum WJT4-NPBG1]
MSIYCFKAIRANQAADHDVFSFAAAPEDILAFSEIERVGREEDGQLRGFQRHQVASHIKDIKDYLTREDALLPNAVIIAFLGNVKVKDIGDGIVEITIDARKSKPGFVVDGQQRLTALSGLKKPGFQVFVSGLICKDYNELRQQFVLINNTRPLPKTLIYELLPTVEGLPARFTARQFAARIVDRLNFTRGASLYGQIRQHTNPLGVISDTAMQKFVMNSASNGAIREFVNSEDYENKAFDLVNEFFTAVENVFHDEWVDMNPKTSRLRHGAGLVAMSFVMESLYSSQGATTSEEFEPGLEALKEYTAWTSGQWRFSEDDVRPWNGIQNTPSDIDILANYLVRSLKRALRKAKRAA